jgi:hypothetical protein
MGKDVDPTKQLDEQGKNIANLQAQQTLAKSGPHPQMQQDLMTMSTNPNLTHAQQYIASAVAPAVGRGDMAPDKAWDLIQNGDKDEADKQLKQIELEKARVGLSTAEAEQKKAEAEQREAEAKANAGPEGEKPKPITHTYVNDTDPTDRYSESSVESEPKPGYHEVVTSGGSGGTGTGTGTTSKSASGAAGPSSITPVRGVPGLPEGVEIVRPPEQTWTEMAKGITPQEVLRGLPGGDIKVTDDADAWRHVRQWLWENNPQAVRKDVWRQQQAGAIGTKPNDVYQYIMKTYGVSLDEAHDFATKFFHVIGNPVPPTPPPKTTGSVAPTSGATPTSSVTPAPSPTPTDSFGASGSY